MRTTSLITFDFKNCSFPSKTQYYTEQTTLKRKVKKKKEKKIIKLHMTYIHPTPSMNYKIRISTYIMKDNITVYVEQN